MKKSCMIIPISVVTLLFPSVSHANYPDKIEAEKEEYKTISLESGTDLNVVSKWLQPVDWQEDVSKYDAFAVSGKYFYIADRSNICSPKLIRFDNETGLFEDEIDIDFGTFNKTTFGHLGCDDFGNLYISSACSVEQSKLIYDDDRMSHNLPWNDTISVIDADGRVTRQWIAATPCFDEGWAKDKFNAFFFDYVAVRGNVNTGEDLLVVVPVGARKNGYGTGWSPNYYMVKNGNLEYIDFTGPVLNAKNLTKANFKSFKLTTVSEEPYFSIYPLNWQNKVFSNYANKEPAEAVVGLPEKESGRYVFLAYSGQSGHPYALPENSTGCTGAINIEYGCDTLMAMPYVDNNSGEIRISITQPVFSLVYNSGITNIKDSNIESSATELVTIPHNGSLKGRTDIGTHMANIQSVDNTSNPASPVVDLYFYAPGRAIGKYTLSQKVIQTSVEAINTDSADVTLKGRVLNVSGKCDVKIYNINGVVVRNNSFRDTGTMNLYDLYPGVYVVKYGEKTTKIIL